MAEWLLFTIFEQSCRLESQIPENEYLILLKEKQLSLQASKLKIGEFAN